MKRPDLRRILGHPSQFRLDDRASHDKYNKEVSDLLHYSEVTDLKLSEEDLQRITDCLCCDFLMPKITVKLSNRFSERYIGRAYYKNMKVSLCKDRGNWVSMLLHEIAHLLPNSWNHNKYWGDNFLMLADWYIGYVWRNYDVPTDEIGAVASK